MLDIDGVAMPAPVKFRVSLNNITKAERNAQGDMVIDLINTKRKIELDLKMLSSEEVSKVLKAVAPVLFKVTYPDPYSNSKETRTFYAGDRSVDGLSFSKGKMSWSGLSFNIIER